MVLARDEYQCQKCGKENVQLHCHHIIPKKMDMMIAHDMDNCITYCKKCHNEVHKQKGCRIQDIVYACKVETQEPLNETL